MRRFLLLIVGWAAFQLSTRGDEIYGGVGIDVGVFNDPDGMEIISVYPRSAAAKAGIYKYQQIRSIDGVTTKGKTRQDCLQRLRGKVGSIVTLELADPFAGRTNIISLARERIGVVDVALNQVVKTNGFVNVNRVRYTESGKSFTSLAHADVSTNQILLVATTNGGIASIRFTAVESSSNTRNVLSNTVHYCWNYRATPTSRLLSGTNSATEVIVWTEERPNRWVGKGMSTGEGLMIVPDIAGLDWGPTGFGKVSVTYDASVYRLRVDELPAIER